MLINQVERQKRVTEVIKHPHEDHQIEAFPERCEVVDRQLAEFDVGTLDLGGSAPASAAGQPA